MFEKDNLDGIHINRLMVTFLIDVVISSKTLDQELNLKCRIGVDNIVSNQLPFFRSSTYVKKLQKNHLKNY